MNEALKELLEILEEALGQNIKTYYRGEVIVPARSYLPCLMVFGNSTEIQAKDTCNDTFEYNVTIRIVSDIMKYVDEKGTGEVIKAQDYLIDAMEGRNEDGTLRCDTVLGALRANLRGKNFLYSSDVRAEYRAIQTGEFFYIKAELQLTAVSDSVKRPTQNI